MSTMDDIYHLVREIEARTAQAKAYAASRLSEVFTAKIAPMLGTVTVNGVGVLLSIELDQRNVQVCTETALAEAIVDAIRRAEAEATAKVGGRR
jgi:DNA-binding protein YbaB